jgi:hypothetical protein
VRPALAIALVSYILLARSRLALHWVLAGAAIAGLAAAS